jgi:hypothetical protein
MMQALSEGGAPALLALLVGLLGLAAGVAQLVLARRFTLLPLVGALVAATLILGLFGFGWGLYSAGSAAAAVDPSQKAVMLAMGISTALNSAAVAAIMACLQIVLGVVAALVRGVAAAPAPAGAGGRP